MANTLLVAPYSLWTPHLETDLELALDSVEQGDQVTWLECRGELGVCDMNPDGRVSRCARCVSRRELGISRAGLDVRRVSVSELLTSADRAALDGLPEQFESLEQLRAFRFAGFDAGFAALSSTVWIAQDSDLDLTAEPHASRMRGLLRSGCAMYLATRRILATERYSSAYLFNGRMAPLRGAFRALREEGIYTSIHERGCDLQHYALSPNALPHEIKPMDSRIRAAWRDAPEAREDRIRIAMDWYDQRVQGHSTNWRSFTEDQMQGRLPKSWDAQAHNIVIFTTTEYEFAAISDEWNNPLYKTNAAAVMGVIDECRSIKGVSLYVRMHPNTAGLDNQSTRQLLHAAGNNIEIIEPESDISTYSLAAHASKVVVTGSSVGIEAAVRGGAAILLGRCYYENLGSVHVPTSRAEVRKLLMDQQLQGLDPLGAHMYGFFMATFGERFTRFDASGLFEGKFMGEEIRPSRWSQRLRRLQLASIRFLGHGQV
jgi:hypothetical protein